MWIKVLKITGFTLLAAAIAAYIVYASMLSIQHHTNNRVTSINVEVSDSTSEGFMITRQQVMDWISQENLVHIGDLASAVNLERIRQTVAGNGYVKSLNTYITYSGALFIKIHQYKPLFRLLTDGYDAYVCEDGTVFQTPLESAQYVPVVTGNFEPVFEQKFEGTLAAIETKVLKHARDSVEKIRHKKYPLFFKEDSMVKLRRQIRKEQLKKEALESKAEWEIRNATFKESKLQRIKKLDAKIRYVRHQQNAIDQVIAEQENLFKKQHERFTDFRNITNFVGWISRDSFWRSEIVQIIANTSSSGAVHLELIPRSGDFHIIFGEIEDIELKFNKLMKFYKNVLTSKGWDYYSFIDISYKGQVVCTK